MTGMPSRAILACIALCALSLCACSKPSGAAGDSAASAGQRSDVALPKPQADGGSVTGMPAKPGPNPVGQALVTPDDSAAPSDADIQLPATADAAGEVAADVPAGDAGTEPIAMTGSEPSAQDAVAVLQDYYSAINQRDFQRAWASWSDGGRSSGQTAQQFSDGFADTTQVALQPGTPGRVEGAAGSRYVQVPVAIEATQRDGTVHRYAGTYTLRRAVVDGATDAQRAWHIGSAALHELPQ